MDNLACRINKLRKEKGLTLERLAVKADTSKAYISQLESGNSKKPSAEILFNIAVALDTSVAFLLGKTKKAADIEKVFTPPNLSKIAVEFGLDDSMIKRLAAVEHRDGKEKQDYSRDKWIQLYYTLKNLDN